MKENFYVGQIFEDIYPVEAAKWCNQYQKKMAEIDPTDVRRFQIQEIPEPSVEETKQARIAELKSELNSTDYKIIKCFECSLAGEELPYDIATLHARRQTIRDEINELENE